MKEKIKKLKITKAKALVILLGVFILGLALVAPRLMSSVSSDAPSGWQSKNRNVVFDANGQGAAVLPKGKAVRIGDKLGDLPTPTRPDYEFVGWTTAFTGGVAVNSATMVTSEMSTTLYAKWQVPALEVPDTSEGSEFVFADARWRILKEDMNDDPSDGKQALVCRIDAISTSRFHQNGTFFKDGTNSTGYDVSLVKAKIDDYYNNTIKGKEIEKYIWGVNLNLPTYDDFKAGQTFSNKTYNDWSWNNFHTDRRFATTLGGTKQGFALSYGDIHTLTGVGADSTKAPILSFGKNDTTTEDEFWLRSPGSSADQAGTSELGSFHNDMGVAKPDPGIRVALAIQIK
jgi:uncharacterized repeat protein (TIGR02543 family)